MEKLLEDIKVVASDNHMDAFIVGSKAFYDYGNEEHIPDGQLLKLCPNNVRTKVLLEIEKGSILYRHRNNQLTKKFKGRKVSLNWILNFIKHNSSLAKTIIADENNKPVIDKSPTIKPEPYTDEEINKLRAQRNTVHCSCSGMLDTCTNCFGKGYYITDGLGKKV